MGCLDRAIDMHISTPAKLGDDPKGAAFHQNRARLRLSTRHPVIGLIPGRFTDGAAMPQYFMSRLKLPLYGKILLVVRPEPRRAGVLLFFFFLKAQFRLGLD